MCGEQLQSYSSLPTSQGSPPRVRGTADELCGEKWPVGITPACAGNRIEGVEKLVVGWDHPRVCGEQFLVFWYSNHKIGSPPRVRGTAIARRGSGKSLGITPACAGNRVRCRPDHAGREDHPRVCGEQTKKSPSFLHSFLSDQENSFSLKYNCSISSQSFCARWTSLQGSSKCFAKVDS